MKRKMAVVMACISRDIPILRYAAENLQKYLPVKEIIVLVPDKQVNTFRRALSNCADTVRIISEDDFIPGVKIRNVREMPGPLYNKKIVGWYFQQMLKLHYCFYDTDDDYYLIWDSDTVPLRSMDFFDENGRMMLCTADEYNEPYFITYKNIFREEPHRDFSFIAQHMIIQKSVAREMIYRIRWWENDISTWPAKLVKSIPGNIDGMLFSEYETYGHYIKNHYPERVSFISRKWYRDGARDTGGWSPGRAKLEEYSRNYEFVAFEKTHNSLYGYARHLARDAYLRVKCASRV